jgi:hypothetical protein
MPRLERVRYRTISVLSFDVTIMGISPLHRARRLPDRAERRHVPS